MSSLQPSSFRPQIEPTELKPVFVIFNQHEPRTGFSRACFRFEDFAPNIDVERQRDERAVLLPDGFIDSRPSRAVHLPTNRIVAEYNPDPLALPSCATAPLVDVGKFGIDGV